MSDDGNELILPSHDALREHIEKVELDPRYTVVGRELLSRATGRAEGLFYLVDGELVCFARLNTEDIGNAKVYRGGNFQTLSKSWRNSEFGNCAQQLNFGGAPVPDVMVGPEVLAYAAVGLLKLPKYYKYMVVDLDTSLVEKIVRKGFIYNRTANWSSATVFFSDKADIAALALLTDKPFKSSEIRWNIV